MEGLEPDLRKTMLKTLVMLAGLIPSLIASYILSQ